MAAMTALLSNTAPEVVRRNGVRPGLVIMLGVLVGCGGPSIPDLVPVQGRLLLDGKPLGGKNVVFSPEEGTPGNGAQGTTDSNGAFDLIAFVGGSTKALKGTRIGRYLVTVSEVEEYLADGTPAPLVSKGTTPRIPDKYVATTTSPLRLDVTSDMPNVTLDLKSK